MVTGKKRIKEGRRGIATLLSLALIPLSGFATDIYLPSLPTMAATMHVGSIQIQFTLTIFLISYGVSQLFIGGVLDSYGRYRLSLAALLIFALSNVVIATTHHIYLIYGMRVIHGITISVIIVGKRAYFVDLFSGDKLKNYLSMFTIIWSAGPIIAPFIGGYLQAAFGWESNFYLLAGLAMAIAVLEFIFGGETLPNPTEFRMKRIVKIYVGMLRVPSFILGIVMLGLAYSMVMVFNMTGPFIIEHHLRLTPVTAGYASLVMGLAWMVGGFIGKASIHRPFFKKLAFNSGLQVLFAVAMLASIRFADNLYSLLFFAFIIHVGAGYTFNNCFTFCLSSFPKNAGIAGGLTGGITYLIVSFMSYSVVALLPASNEHNLGCSYLLLILLSVLVTWFIFKKKESAQPSLQAG